MEEIIEQVRQQHLEDTREDDPLDRSTAIPWDMLLDQTFSHSDNGNDDDDDGIGKGGID